MATAPTVVSFTNLTSVTRMLTECVALMVMDPTRLQSMAKKLLLVQISEQVLLMYSVLLPRHVLRFHSFRTIILLSKHGV